jgi:hypothetical protein
MPAYCRGAAVKSCARIAAMSNRVWIDDKKQLLIPSSVLLQGIDDGGAVGGPGLGIRAH